LHEVGVITIGFLLLRVFGGILAKPWKIMILDKGALLLMDSDTREALLYEISTASSVPFEANEPHDV
jgi:hypothetical protein